MSKAAKENKITERRMGNGKRLTLSEKILIRAEKDTGKSRVQVGQEYGVSDTTVGKIWKDEKLSNFKRQVQTVKEALSDKFTIAVDSGLNRVLETIGDANVQQAGVVTGIMFDKMRLLNNQSTQNHAVEGYLNLCNEAVITIEGDKTD